MKIGFSHNKANYISKFIRFFTRSKWSHCFIEGYPIDNKRIVLEAHTSVRMVPFDKFYKNNPNKVYEIYEIDKSSLLLEQGYNQIFFEYIETYYGYIQMPWFIYRYIYELIFKKTPQEAGWFSEGVICSELVYFFLLKVCPDILNYAKINPDTVQPEDLYKLVLAHPELFKLVESGGGLSN